MKNIRNIHGDTRIDENISKCHEGAHRETCEESSQTEEQQILSELGLSETGATIKRDEYDNIIIIKYPKIIGASYTLGIDEAGRGPLAGHLVYSMLFWETQPENTFFRDSKKTGCSTRNSHYHSILSNQEIGAVVYCISAKFISLNMINNMNDRNSTIAMRQSIPLEHLQIFPNQSKKLKINEKSSSLLSFAKVKQVHTTTTTPDTTATSDIPNATNRKRKATDKCEVNNQKPSLYISMHRKNLNELSLYTVESSISEYISEKIPITTVYMDIIGPSALCIEVIQRAFTKSTTIKEIVVEKKADSKYQVVSAASILAKVIRDSLIKNEALQMILYGETYPDIGSGYPSDAITNKWLQTVYTPIFGFPSIIRSSWRPVLLFLKKKAEHFQEVSLRKGKALVKIPDYQEK
ncbi:ribonuclease H2 subunit A [Nematocida sp. LUAm3]|nr:ribonuclease H2 subunit A [Nematocida sp. LUAm3]KAI5176007.1 ribonuclease H2 subunit A [Nematocida sp. LUAm2]KAI5179104.1 ribonuclease H2 subunit A [Nematocida sp. LUAm1]